MPTLPLSTDLPPSSGTAIAAVLANPMRRRVADLLAGAPDGLTVADLAESLEAHPNALRRHLATMASAGLVSAATDPPQGRGRPTVRYTLIELDDVTMVSAHQELVRMLVQLLGDLGADDQQVAAFGEQHGDRLLRGEGRAGVVSSLSRLGFAPHEVTPRAAVLAGELHLRLEHCPFRDAVLAPGGDMVCSLHRGLLTGMARGAAPGAELSELEVREPLQAGCMLRMTGLGPAPS